MSGIPHLEEDADRTAILVVDDRPDKILVLRSVLEDLGQVIVSAGSGDEALRHVLERDFAVILLDVNMPGMDGFETASLVRKRKRSSHTPIIFMTAYADEMHADQAYSLGAVDYILTPFAPEVLRAKVRVFVHLHQMAERLRRQASQLVALAREQEARAAAEAAVRRAAFLAEAGQLLASTLDPEAIARDFSAFAVPTLGNLCVLAIVDDHGHAQRTEIAWSEPGTPGRHVRSVKRVQDASLRAAIANVLLDGRPQVISGPAGVRSLLEVEALAEDEMPIVSLPFEVSAVAIYPLAARGRRVGALAVALAPPRGAFTPAELALGEEVAGRVGIALDNARLYLRVRENDNRKDEFLAMLAHELRNPLAPIRNAIEVLRIPGVGEARTPWARDVIDRQSRQLVRIVDDLLDVSRITRGKVTLKKEDVDVASVLAAAVETSRPLCEERKHHLTANGPDAELNVRGDFARIAQVLSNLLNNAAKYTPNGGHIEVSAAREGHEVVFRVRDNGIGIPEHMLEGIFELFTQLDQSLDRAQGGLGIGLTLVKRLVEAQGGAVRASSGGPGAGSEFTVRLPLSDRQERAASGPPGDRTGPPRRVLIVEDHADAAQTLATLVQLHGHEVRQASDGNAALQLIADYRPDVLLLDIGLPGMDGFEIARRMRDAPATRGSLIVAISGYGQERDRRRALDCGFDHHFVKPVNPQALMSLLQEAEVRMGPN